MLKVARKIVYFVKFSIDIRLVLCYNLTHPNATDKTINEEENTMNEKWTLDQLFYAENEGNPFQRGPEEMLLWECRGEEEAVIVWRGYDMDILRNVAEDLEKKAGEGIRYCVEFPGRKGPRDGKPMEKRKFEGGAKCLPKPKNQFLITLVENKWGATLNEAEYMRSRGRVLEFYMRTDKEKKPVFTFGTWEEVQKMAFTKRR